MKEIYEFKTRAIGNNDPWEQLPVILRYPIEQDYELNVSQLLGEKPSQKPLTMILAGLCFGDHVYEIRYNIQGSQQGYYQRVNSTMLDYWRKERK